MNHNVRVSLWWSLFENISASVRSGDTLSALIYLTSSKRGGNITVGIIQGANGIAMMVAALPAGWLADRYRRDVILRAGAGWGAAAGLVLALALAVRPTVWMLGASMALLGVYRGTTSAALEALFADSVPPGQSGLYTRKYVITAVASSFGPWLSLALFHRLGNRWDADDCRLVLLSGLALMVLPLILMCTFDDAKALQAPAQPGWGRQQQQQQQQQQEQQGHGPRQVTERESHALLLPTTAVGGAGSGLDQQPLTAAENGQACVLEAADIATAVPASCVADSYEQTQVHQAPRRRGCCGTLPDGLVVTLLIGGSDLIGALASGMTLKFFAMYFMQSVGMLPVAVSLIGALAPLGVSAASLACQRLSKVVGRVQISLVTRCLDIVLLVMLAHLPFATAPARRLLVAVHLLRMAFANATRPLMRSVLMDFVPRQYRGKVNAVDSIRTFSWSGSAALGGFLIERIGFRRTFLVTAGIKTAVLVPLFFLLAYVPDGVCVSRLARLERQQRAAAGCGEHDNLRQPLLDTK
ncbi:hypothetical protein D9Q98_003147 [Chlorella vulgaris]|uniref:Major facilitator superfamily (MFS) profile domain-containing protein n=1 Tax=Chlorella vulgaris TaxID=3077 RepID=A0A9D4TSG9_CHLVU|nr:hypothetical protein D9Q98_003147 [Chlorella vulgaris]